MARFKLWDRVVVINLDTSPDRLVAFRAECAKSAMLSRANVQRFAAFGPHNTSVPAWYRRDNWKEGPLKAQYWACRRSHVAVLERAILDGVEHLLVLEDDAEIMPDFDTTLPSFFEAMPDDWLGYLLGYFSWNQPQHVNARCDRSRGYGGAHAYGLNRRGIARAYEHLEWHNQLPNDIAMAGLHREEPYFYAPPQELVKQRKGVVSDITGTVNNYSYGG